MAVTPLSTAEISDTRRFAGYPIEGAVSAQTLAIQGNSVSLDTIIGVLTDDQVNTLRTVYLANFYTIETGIASASATLDVATAAVYKRNPNELLDRESLFESWRLKLCYFLGVAPGSGIYSAAGAFGPVPAAFAV